MRKQSDFIIFINGFLNDFVIIQKTFDKNKELPYDKTNLIKE